MIDQQTIDKIRSAADILDVVKDFVSLKKAGANYKGLCPFHDERTPSFVVSPAKQLFKCFSCGKGGDAVTFVMQHEQMTYPEALKWLAKKYGIFIEERELTDEDKKSASIRESMFALNAWADEYFQNILHESVDGSAIGMAYFRSRGFRDDIIKKFHLGYCLPGKETMSHDALKKGFNEEFLIKTGLSFKTEHGALYDRFSSRVIFPIHTISGRVVGFGGRILGNDAKQQHVGKYVNSPESEIYDKSSELYGLYQAKHAISKHSKCYLVEGYTDVISMHQNGIENVVASSGTSLTKGQIRLLHRFTKNVTVLYDGDSAGIKASLRGIDMLLAEGLNVNVLLLPEGEDPDSFSKKQSTQSFLDYIQKHETDFIQFKTHLLLKDVASDPQKRSEAIREIVKSIAVIPDRITQQTFVAQCAKQVGIQENIIASEVHAETQKQRSNQPTQQKEQGNDASATSSSTSTQPLVLETSCAIERELLKIVIRHGSACLFEEKLENEEPYQWTVANYILANLTEDDIQFSNPLYQDILNSAVTLPVSSSSLGTMHHFLNHSNPQIQQIAAQLADDNYELSFRQKAMHTPDEERLVEIVSRLLNEFKFQLVEKKQNELLSKLNAPETQNDQALMQQLMKDYIFYNAIKQKLSPLIGERILTL
ncbi:MAG: DNA primase [Bacteroidaceae bacterium]|nr:DNA primase [Bacteroidaceae bacterium]